MFKYLRADQIEGIKDGLAALSGVSPKDLYFILDYNDTIVIKKGEDDPNYAPLTPEQYQFWQKVAPQIGGVLNITAQDAHIFQYLRSPDLFEFYGPIENFSVGLSSGHEFLPDIAADEVETEEPRRVAVPGYRKKQDLLQNVIDCTHGLSERMILDFNGKSGVSAWNEQRSMGTTFIYTYDGDDPALAEQIKVRAEKLLKERTIKARSRRFGEAEDRPLSSCVTLSPRSFVITLPNGKKRTLGYIDIKIRGMNKGLTAKKILTTFLKAKKDSVVIVAGDSFTSDAPMMRAMLALLKIKRVKAVINVGVGKRFKEKMLEAKRNGQDHPANGGKDNPAHLIFDDADQEQAVKKLYRFLEDVIQSCGPLREPVRRLNASSKPEV